MAFEENKEYYDYFMQQAIEIAEKALHAGEFPVGCVIEYHGKIIASGYRKGSSGNNPNEIDHAEIITLKELYNYPEKISRHELTIFCTMEPCLMCFGAILLSGIRKIVYAYEDVMGGGTRCPLDQVSPLYRVNPIIIPNVLRHNSLKLFKTFFSDPNNVYWKGSLLAEYTLQAE